METLVHTAEGELKREGPVLSIYCKSHTANLDHEPIPCIDGTGELCQCSTCCDQHDRRRSQ